MPAESAQHGQAAMDAAAMATIIAITAEQALATRNADGLQTAGAQMCRIATAAEAPVEHAPLQDAIQQKLQVLTAGLAHAIILLTTVFILIKIAAAQA